MAKKDPKAALAKVAVATATGGWKRGAGEAGNQVIDWISGRDRDDAYGMMLRQVNAQLAVLGRAYRADEPQIENALRQAKYAFEDKALAPKELAEAGMDPARAAAELCKRADKEILMLDDETTRDVCREAIQLVYAGLLEDPTKLPAAERGFQQRVLELQEHMSVQLGNLSVMPQQQQEALDLLRSIAAAALTPADIGSGRSDFGGVQWPVRVGLLPAVAEDYQARSELDLTHLLGGTTSALSPARPRAPKTGDGDPDVPADGRVVCLVAVGMGGTGKTQLAAQYTSSVQDTVDVRVWVTATSRAAVVEAYSLAAVRLRLRNPLDLTLDREDAAAAFLEWMRNDRGRSWLIVLDDVQDPADITGLRPSGPLGRVLLTTRIQDTRLAAWGHVLVVDLYTLEEAVAYLANTISSAQQPQDAVTAEGELTALATDLGRLPLALAQAAAYLGNRVRTTVAGYRRLFADTAKRLEVTLPSEDAPAHYRPEDRAHASVTTTWVLSIEQADLVQPLGLSSLVLEVLAWLDPNGVPLILLNAPSLLRHFTERKNRSTEPAVEHIIVDQDMIAAAVDALERFSVATPSASRDNATVHQLVQRVTRERHGLNSDLLVVIARGLAETWFGDGAQAVPGPAKPTIATQVMAFTQLIDFSCRHDNPALSLIMSEVGSFMSGRGESRTALTLMERLRLLSEASLDAKSQLYLHNLNAIGDAYRAGGRIDQAIGLHQKVIDVAERIYGNDALLTMSSRELLAHALQARGDIEASEVLTERVMEDYARTRGPDDQLTRSSQANLTAIRQRVRGATQAANSIADYHNHIAQLKLATDSHDPTIIWGLENNLAIAYRSAGETTKAIDLHRRVLKERRAYHGEAHPDVYESTFNLANALCDQSSYDEARALFEVVLHDRRSKLGEVHPATLVVRDRISNCHRLEGQ